MTIPKYILCITVASLSLLCTSCRENTGAMNKETIVHDEMQLYYRLDSLSKVYSSLQNGLCCAARKKQTADGEFTKEQQNKIAKADMEGYAIGYGIGIGTGTLIATVNAPAGFAIGITSAFALAEVFSARWSSVAADEIREATKAEITMEDLYKLDPYHPINDFSTTIPWFDPSIPGASAGFLHNYSLSLLYKQHSEDFFELSAAQLSGDILDLLLQESYDDHETYEIRTFAYNHLEQDLANWNSENSIISSEEVIQHYFQLLEEIPEENYIAFTGEYMQIVYQEIGDEDRVILINGCLSTYVYSLHFWNLNVPYLYRTTYLCQNRQNRKFETVMCTNPREVVLSWVTTGKFSIIAIPAIREERIVALFVFDELNPYFANNIINNRYVQIEENGAYLNTIDNPAIIFEEERSKKQYACPKGRYEFQKFKEGYVVFFE